MRSTMLTFLKVLGGIFALLFLCLLLLLGIFKFSDPNKYKPVIVERFKAATGGDLEIQGAIDVHIFPTPSIALEDVYVDMPLATGQDVILKSKNLYIKADLFSYFSSDFKIDAFKAKEVHVGIHQKSKPSIKLKAEELSGRMLTDCCGFDMPNLKIVSVESKLTGDIRVQTDLTQPLIKGKLNASHFEFSNFIETEKSSMPPSARVVPSVDIPFDFLDSVILDLDLTFDDLKLGDSTLDKGRLSVSAANGQTDIKLMDARMHSGALEGDIELKKTGAGRGKVKANFNAKQVKLESIMGSENIKGGQFDIDFSGHGAGKSLRDVLAHWDGKALWVMKKAQITNVSAREGLSAATKGLFNFLSPGQASNNTPVQCAAMRYEVINGTAYALNQIALETDKIDVLGSGKINLKNEVIDFEFNLRKKQGIDLKLGKVDKYIRLEGTLKDPKVVVNPKGVLEESLSLLSALATGGLSVLAEQIFDKLGDKGSRCAYVAHGEN